MPANRTMNRIKTALLLAMSLTLGVELVYIISWGFVLFPEGSWLSKIFLAATCGLGMGNVFGAMTLLFVEGRHTGWSAMSLAAFVLGLVGGYCALLCARLDQDLRLFGGENHQALLTAAGIFPAITGGPLYGWLFYRPSPDSSTIEARHYG